MYVPLLVQTLFGWGGTRRPRIRFPASAKNFVHLRKRTRLKVRLFIFFGTLRLFEKFRGSERSPFQIFCNKLEFQIAQGSPFLHVSASWDCFNMNIFRLKLNFINMYSQWIFQYHPKFWRNFQSKALYHIADDPYSGWSEFLTLYPNWIAFYWGGGGASKTGVFQENVLRIFKKLRFLSLRHSADFRRSRLVERCIRWFAQIPSNFENVFDFWFHHWSG